MNKIERLFKQVLPKSKKEDIDMSVTCEIGDFIEIDEVPYVVTGRSVVPDRLEEVGNITYTMVNLYDYTTHYITQAEIYDSYFTLLAEKDVRKMVKNHLTSSVITM